ncbi:MAG: TRAP transporter small permease [Deltaproteobacteria bacterium]|nr:TRAP transporter small permease [Deltaproteobacteria bacterium]MBW2128960.1 TRAP transporter small permease [Deltaproteobacteria bacterium]MBW2302758.1 TRAP transporter small permease [Deltaproteobacteria bacterium]
MPKRDYIRNTDPVQGRFECAVEWLITWAARVAGILLLVVGFFVFYEVVCRHIFRSPTLWVMDYSIYLVMWAVFLGSAYTMRSRGHVLVDVVISRIDPGIRRIIKLGIHVIIFLFALTITSAGIYSCIRAYQMKELTLSALYIPLYYPMSSIPVGFALLALEEMSMIRKLVSSQLDTGSRRGKAHK